MKTHEGRCHCGEVSFAVKTELECPIRCNCSFCRRRGAVVQIVDAQQFTLMSGTDYLTQYGNQPFAKHHFCNQCGIQVFTRISENDGEKVAVSLACLPDIDIESLTPMKFDGATLF